MPMILDLEIFLDEVAPPAGEDQAAAIPRPRLPPSLQGPVDPAVGRLPVVKNGVGRDGSAVERFTVHGAGYGFESSYV